MSIQRSVSRCVRSLFRSMSTEYRAYGDLFINEYADRVPWMSGIGEGLYTLYGLARSLKPEVIVETGSARGRSTCALALACRANQRGKVFAIDPHLPNRWSEIGTGGNNLEFLKQRLALYDLNPWCEIVQATSSEAVKTWTRRIDLLFIDGDHAYDGVRGDFEMFQPFLKPTALVVFHDSMWEYQKDSSAYSADIGVPRYLADLKRQGYQSVTLPCVPGMTILQPIAGGFEFLPGKMPFEKAFVA